MEKKTKNLIDYFCLFGIGENFKSAIGEEGI